MKLRCFAVCLSNLAGDGIAELSTETGDKSESPKLGISLSTDSIYREKSADTTGGAGADNTPGTSSSFSLLSHSLSFLLRHFHLRRSRALKVYNIEFAFF